MWNEAASKYPRGDTARDAARVRRRLTIFFKLEPEVPSVVQT